MHLIPTIKQQPAAMVSAQTANQSYGINNTNLEEIFQRLLDSQQGKPARNRKRKRDETEDEESEGEEEIRTTYVTEQQWKEAMEQPYIQDLLDYRGESCPYRAKWPAEHEVRAIAAANGFTDASQHVHCEWNQADQKATMKMQVPNRKGMRFRKDHTETARETYVCFIKEVLTQTATIPKGSFCVATHFGKANLSDMMTAALAVKQGRYPTQEAFCEAYENNKWFQEADKTDSSNPIVGPLAHPSSRIAQCMLVTGELDNADEMNTVKSNLTATTDKRRPHIMAEKANLYTAVMYHSARAVQRKAVKHKSEGSVYMDYKNCSGNNYKQLVEYQLMKARSDLVWDYLDLLEKQGKDGKAITINQKLTGKPGGGKGDNPGGANPPKGNFNFTKAVGKKKYNLDMLQPHDPMIKKTAVPSFWQATVKANPAEWGMDPVKKIKKTAGKCGVCNAPHHDKQSCMIRIILTKLKKVTTTLPTAEMQAKWKEFIKEMTV